MPNNKILLITTDYLKRNSVVNLNLDDELLRPFITKSQNLKLEEILGSNLFNTIMDQVSTSGVEARMDTLIKDYIQPVLVEWTTYYALPYLNYKLTNKAVVRKSSENSESASLNELNYLRQDIRDDAEYLSQRLTKYLQERDNIYTEYDNGNNDIDSIKPVKNSFFSGIVLKNNNYYDDNDNECCYH